MTGAGKTFLDRQASEDHPGENVIGAHAVLLAFDLVAVVHDAADNVPGYPAGDDVMMVPAPSRIAQPICTTPPPGLVGMTPS